MIAWITGKGIWLRKSIEKCEEENNSAEEVIGYEPGSNCVKRAFNVEMVNNAMPLIKHSCNTLLVLSALACILSLKWRKFSDYLSYLMVMFQVIISQIPSDKYDRTESLLVYFLAFIGFVWFYTGHGM